jgi:hypothetical protein
VQLHAESLTLTLPSNAQRQHQLALQLSRTLLQPKRLTIKAAEEPCNTDVGEALSIPELAATFSSVKEVVAHLPCSHNLAAVSEFSAGAMTLVLVAAYHHHHILTDAYHVLSCRHVPSTCASWST